MLLHRGHVGQRDLRRHAVEAGEADVVLRILDHVAVEVGHRAAGADLGRHILVSEQAHIARIPARLVRQVVGLGAIGGRTERARLRAVHPDTHEVGERLARVGCHLVRLWRAGAEDGGDVGRNVLEHCVGRGHLADIAARSGVRNPWRGSVVPARGDHVEVGVGRRRGVGIEDRVSPVGERHACVGCAVGVEVAVTV